MTEDYLPLADLNAWEYCPRDAVEEWEGQLVPIIEYKKGKIGRHLSDHFQLCAAGLCLEQRLGRSIALGEIFYDPNQRRERMVFSPELRIFSNILLNPEPQLDIFTNGQKPVAQGDGGI